MTSLSAKGFRSQVALVAALALVLLTLRSAAAEPLGGSASTAQAPDTSTAADTETPVKPAPAPAAPEATPRLQFDDEAPSNARTDLVRVPRSRAQTEEVEERPFWKSWVFWAVTGVLVAGAVGMIAYTASGTNPSLAPCPADVQVSLGCFGAGRGQ